MERAVNMIINRHIKQCPGLALLAILACMLPTSTLAATELALSPPNDPRQSITYWKAHTVAPDDDSQVAKSHAIFSVLLRSWDNSRLEPGLYVVESTSGAWAASLADGNILLSRDAINTCMSFGENRGEHLLAFVLAHELAHQRADDLWHQRFFRMVGNSNPATRKKMLQGLQLDDALLSDLERKEAQADHDGLILMSSVGYDAYQIIDNSAQNGKEDGKDFFTTWVENIWQESCDKSQSSLLSQASSLDDACQQAQSRALRTRAQLKSVATQSMLYELGVQTFVAKQYAQAREYFTAYGRDYPSRAVLSALGLTYLAEALDSHSRLIELGEIKQPGFYYPLMLDSSADAHAVDSLDPQTQKRASRQILIKQQRDAMHTALKQSIQLFEKAIRLEPNHRKSYLLLATAHLLDSNSYMVRGILQGRYLPKFSNDSSVDMLLALTSAIEGNSKKAAKEFKTLLDKITAQTGKSAAMPQNLLVYSAYFNSAVFATYNGDDKKAQVMWKQLAQQAKSSGNSLLFRMALSHLTQQASPVALTEAPTIRGKRLGDKLDNKFSSTVTAQTKNSSITPLFDELWIDGEQYKVYRNKDGSRYITTVDGKIISASQETGKATLANTLSSGDDADRPLKTLGIPDRRLDMQSGEYLAYDRYGLALHIINDKISGWFLYNNQ